MQLPFAFPHLSNARRWSGRCWAAMAATLLLSGWAAGQGLDPKLLLQPATTDWPSYNGDYSGRRFSTLNQINAHNVADLAVAWAFPNLPAEIKSTPLVVDGVMYFTVPEHVFAIDARSGTLIWHYHYAASGDHIGHRGVAMYRNWLYFTTPDARLICLDAKDGSVRWNVELADPKQGYFSTMAPLVIDHGTPHVVVGVSGDVTDIPGYLTAFDPETGKLQWRWYTEPKTGEPGSETWPNADAREHGGGMTWMTGTYDPEAHLLYWGTGNPNPVMAGESRPGDNLYTCSIVALDPETGKLVWAFQPSPHDLHDWDAVETPVLFDAPFHGQPRKLLAQASRNGFFFLLDRLTGEHLVTAPFIDINWAQGIDAQGRPIARPDKAPSPQGTLVEPGSDGATNWMSPSFDPQTGLFYVVARRIFSVFYKTNEGKPEGWAGRDRNLWANSTIRALDYRTGKVIWNHEIGQGESSAGIMTTAGGLLFSADLNHHLLALDPRTGKTLWHLNLGNGVDASPMTFELDGRQYYVIGVGNILYAFTVPGAPAVTSARAGN